MTSPPASVIVLTYNNRGLIEACLASFCSALLATSWEIIVVDNGSTDGTAKIVQTEWPEVQVIRSDRNRGFAGGNNLGLRSAHGRVVILLNSDVIITAPTLQALAERLLSQPEAGVLSPGLLTADGRPQAFAFGGDPTLSYLARRSLRALLGLGPLHNWNIQQPIETDWVSAACLCVRREILEQAGLLDERFFLYFEDNDWCLRIRQAGWKIVYEPRLTAIHIGGASQPHRQIANRIYRQSLIAFYTKHYGLLNTILVRLLLIPYTLLIGIHSSQSTANK